MFCEAPAAQLEQAGKSQPPNQNKQVRNIRTQWNTGTTTIRKSLGATVHLKPHFQLHLTYRTSKATCKHMRDTIARISRHSGNTHGKPTGNCRNAEGPHATPNRMPTDFMPLFMRPNRTATGQPPIQWDCKGAFEARLSARGGMATGVRPEALGCTTTMGWEHYGVTGVAHGGRWTRQHHGFKQGNTVT